MVETRAGNSKLQLSESDIPRMIIWMLTGQGRCRPQTWWVQTLDLTTPQHVTAWDLLVPLSGYNLFEILKSFHWGSIEGTVNKLWPTGSLYRSVDPNWESWACVQCAFEDKIILNLHNNWKKFIKMLLIVTHQNGWKVFSIDSSLFLSKPWDVKVLRQTWRDKTYICGDDLLLCWSAVNPSEPELSILGSVEVIILDLTWSRSRSLSPPRSLSLSRSRSRVLAGGGSMALGSGFGSLGARGVSSSSSATSLKMFSALPRLTAPTRRLKRHGRCWMKR